MIAHWQPVTSPPAPGHYWTIRRWADPADKTGVRIVHTKDAGWQKFDGEQWRGQEEPTHYYHEATNA